MLLSTLIGLLTILISCAMLLHEQSNVEAATALIHDLPLSLVTGIGVLICGLAIVLGHNVWSGGVLPVVITIYGWSLLIRGVLLLCLSSDARASIFEMLHLKDLFLFYVTINLSLGVYLTYGGFRVCLAPSGSEWDATLVEVEPAKRAVQFPDSDLAFRGHPIGSRNQSFSRAQHYPRYHPALLF
jgi:hypothetical protein